MLEKILLFVLGIIFGMVLMCFIAYKWSTSGGKKNDNAK